MFTATSEHNLTSNHLTLIQPLQENSHGNKPNSEKISTAPDSPTTANEEILKLLRQLVGQDSNANEQNLEASPEDAENDNEDDVESHEAVDTLDEDDDYTDNDLETVGYIVGGAALVGAGALLYHILRKL